VSFPAGTGEKNLFVILHDDNENVFWFLCTRAAERKNSGHAVYEAGCRKFFAITFFGILRNRAYFVYSMY
jgi:hypothetical protein